MQTVETFPSATPFPLDDPYTAYNNMSLKDNMVTQRLHLFRMHKQKIQRCYEYNSEQLTNHLIAALDGKLDHPLNLYFVNDVMAEYRQKYIILEEFMKGLVYGCDDQLFRKFMCYFQSPRRLCGCDGACVALGNLLTRIRNRCKKHETEIELNSREKLEWINDLFNEACTGKKPKSNDKIFKFSENLEFSISNMVFCNDHYHVIGFQCDDCFSQSSMKQLFYTFPTIIAMQLKQSNTINKDYYTCFTFDNKRMLLPSINVTKGTRDEVLLDTTTTEISLANKFVIRAFAIILLQCQSKYPNDNICNSAIKNAKLQRQEKVLSMKSYYDYLFKKLSSTKGPNVSEITQKICKGKESFDFTRHHKYSTQHSHK